MHPRGKILLLLDRTAVLFIGLGCDQYIHRVPIHLCRWLRVSANFESTSKENNGRGNAHRTVITLYNLLEKKCRYDFDAAEVLNSCSDESAESYH